MGGLSDWFLLYGGVVLVLALLDGVMGAVFWLVRSRHDRAHPDDLPRTAGEFAAETAARLGLPVRVLAVVSEKQGTDAFFPSARAVTLTTHTHVKRDPTCWAIAAHELGHAAVHLKGPLVAVVLQGARALAGVAKALGTTALLGNLAFASPEVSRLGLVSLLVALGATLLVLVDEALASALALRMLRDDGRLTAERLKSARQVLVAAFSTYAANAVGLGLLVAAWRQLDAVALGRSFVPAEPLAGVQAAIAAALALAVVGAALRGLVLALLPEPTAADLGFFVRESDDPERRRKLERGLRARRQELAQRDRRREVVHDLVRGALVVLLLGWVWDQPYGAGAPAACILAVMGARLAIALLLSPALLCLAVPVLLILAPALVGFGVVLGALHQEPDHGAGFEARQARAARDSAAALEELADATARSPSWIQRTGRWLEIAAPLPLAAMVLWFAVS